MKEIFWRRAEGTAGGPSTIDRGGGGEKASVIIVSEGGLLGEEGVRGVGGAQLRDIDGAMHLHLNNRALPANFLKSRHFDQYKKIQFL